jgi:hypothetical protein
MRDRPRGTTKPGPRLSEAGAIGLAGRYVAENRSSLRCSEQVIRVAHIAAELLERMGARRQPGCYLVTFAYAGPPTPPEFAGLCPPYDSPTTIIVNDRTGECELLMGM